MKIIQYTTNEHYHLRQCELKPTGGKAAGIPVVEISDEVAVTRFDGFGVALTGSTCYELNSMPSEKRAAFLNSIYGKDGLGLSVGRVSVGSCDYSAELYTYDDTENDISLSDFSIDRDRSYIIPMLREIMYSNPDMKLFASPWSPPGWMKTGGSICGGFMREEYIDCYTNYLVKFIKAYNDCGIHISALTAQNETETAQDGKMPACIWHPDIESKFIIALRKKLDDAGINSEIWMYDHNFSNWTRVLWCLENYPELADACAGVAWHYYNGGVEMIDNVRERFPDMDFIFSEGGPRLFDNYGTDWCKWSVMMAKALNHGCRIFTGWQLLLDEMGGPNIGPFFCGGLATLNSQTGELTYSGQYHAFAHFAKYIKRNAKILKSSVTNEAIQMSSFPNTGVPICTCAAENSDGSFVLELINADSQKRQLQFFRNEKWWYVEMLPDSVVTVLFEK